MTAARPAQKPELVLQSGHVDKVFAVAFSPDGETLASASADGSIKLWSVVSGKMLSTLERVAYSVTSITFSPDGHELACGTSRLTKIWSLATGEFRTLEDSESVYSVKFSPNGQVIAGGHDKAIRLWDVASGKVLRILNGHKNSVKSISFTVDGQRLVSGSRDGSVKLWSVATGKELLTFQGPTTFDNPIEVAVSPDGQTLAGGSFDGSLKLWDVASGRELPSLQVYANSVRSLAFSPDGRTLASGGADGTIKLWDVRRGNEVRVLQGISVKTLTNFSGVLSIVFSPDGRTLATAENDKRIRLWEVATGQTIRTLFAEDSVRSVSFSADGQTLDATGAILSVWRLPSGTRLRTPRGNPFFSPDGSTLAIAGAEGISLLELATGNILGRLPHRWSRAIAFSPDAKTLISVNTDGVKLWQVASGKELRSFQIDSDPMSLFGFSPNGQILATTLGRRGGIKLWDVEGGTELAALLQEAKLSSIVFSPDNRMLARTLRDGSIQTYVLGSGRELRTFVVDDDDDREYRLVSFSPDSRTLAGVDISGGITLWEVVSGKELHKLQTRVWPGEITFSPNGRILANSNGRETTMDLWDVATGTKLGILRGHSARVTSIAFSPNEDILASGSEDGTLRLWDVQTQTEICRLIAVGEDDWLVVTPDGLFDGSPAAWNRILWRFSQRLYDVAPVEAFFSDFYHPGLLAEIFVGKRPHAAKDIAQKDRRLPSINLTLGDSESTRTPSRTVSVRVTVSEAPADKDHSTNGGAQDLRLFRNGSLVKVWRGDLFGGNHQQGCKPAGEGKAICETNIRIVAGDNRFTAYAFNHDNIKSEDAALSVSGAESLKGSKTAYVMAIGINEYANPQYNLRYAGADARAFADELQQQQIKLKQFDKVKVISLIDKEATKANILKTVKNITSQAQPEDAVFIYFAGHGTAQGNRYYLIPHDLGYAGARTKLDQRGLETILSHSISDRELEQAFEELDARTVTLVLDTCNSGQALESEEKRRGPMNSKGLAQLAYEKGMYILTAAESFQAAREAARLGHGYLTYALVEEGLKSAAADAGPKDGEVNLREWLDYATQRVPQMQREAMEQTRDLQHPLIFVEGEENIKDPLKRSLQTPRVFYRREPVRTPLVVAKP